LAPLVRMVNDVRGVPLPERHSQSVQDQFLCADAFP
jgi:hypothetical protein